MTARRPTSFRLSPEALASLESLAARHAMRRSDVLEWLLTGVTRTRQRGANKRRVPVPHGKAADIRSAVQLARAAHALSQSTEGRERELALRLIERAHAFVAADPPTADNHHFATAIDMGIPQRPTAVPHPRLVAMLLDEDSHDRS